jgi:hypothetical protein
MVLSKQKLNEIQRAYRATKRGHVCVFLGSARSRSKKWGLECDLTLEYLLSIATDRCPIFGTEFDWGSSGLGAGQCKSPNAPSLDRVLNEIGYIQGNVVFISNVANKIKHTVTEKELYAVADWLHDKRKEVLNAFKDKPTPVPRPPDTPGRKSPAHGPVHGARAGKDCDGSQHHQGEFFGADTGHCA